MSALAAGINLAYPAGDVILLLLVVGSTTVMSGRQRAPWMLLALGFAVNMLGDGMRDRLDPRLARRM